MKLFVIIAVSVIVCSNAQTKQDIPKIVQLLEATVNEIKLQSQKDLAQENALNDLRAKVESLELTCTCDRDEEYTVCGSTGWTRVAYLNMSDPSQRCPTELRLYNEGGVRACGRQTTLGGSCDSVTLSTNGMNYSQVCGRVIGYQYGSPDALYDYGGTLIDNPYIEGISITHGSPRQHIWTLINGRSETGTISNYCPCNNGSTVSVPSFVGDDYFCESGSPSRPTSPYQLYHDDPLWDGEGCGGDEGPCCNVPGIPWFHKVLSSSTTDNIELRVCGDHVTWEEDSPVSLYEMYVK